MRPNEPERPARVPVTRPVDDETRTVERPKPDGFERPIPAFAPIFDAENIVVRGAGEYEGAEIEGADDERAPLEEMLEEMREEMRGEAV